jgi:F0F1-type ATP synthase alpha subunit
LDKVPVKRVREWELAFHAFMREQKSEIRNELAKNLDMTDDLSAKIDACMKEFHAQFAHAEERAAA